MNPPREPIPTNMPQMECGPPLKVRSCPVPPPPPPTAPMWRQEQDLNLNVTSINDAQYLLNKCESDRFWAGIMTMLLMLMWLLAIVCLWILTIDINNTNVRNSYIGVATLATFGGLIAFVASMVWAYSKMPPGQKYVQLGI